MGAYAAEKQRKLDIRYLKMARIWAENSYCVRRQVGALIVKDKMIISDGYNGTPSGFENICENDMAYFDKSSLIKKRYIVGGAQKVVMPYFANMGRMSSEWNLSKS